MDKETIAQEIVKVAKGIVVADNFRKKAFLKQVKKDAKALKRLRNVSNVSVLTRGDSFVLDVSTDDGRSISVEAALVEPSTGYAYADYDLAVFDADGRKVSDRGKFELDGRKSNQMYHLIKKHLGAKGAHSREAVSDISLNEAVIANVFIPIGKQLESALKRVRGADSVKLDGTRTRKDAVSHNIQLSGYSSTDLEVNLRVSLVMYTDMQVYVFFDGEHAFSGKITEKIESNGVVPIQRIVGFVQDRFSQ